jgi:hypothetical protein
MKLIIAAMIVLGLFFLVLVAECRSAIMIDEEPSPDNQPNDGIDTDIARKG